MLDPAPPYGVGKEERDLVVSEPLVEERRSPRLEYGLAGKRQTFEYNVG